MKKAIILFIIISFTFHKLKAQESPNGFSLNRLEIGIEGGPDLAFQVGGYASVFQNAPLISFSTGCDGQYNFTHKFSINTGILFEQKGNYSNTPVTDNRGAPIGEAIIDRNLYDYLVLPILARYSFTETSIFFIEGGPYFGFLLNHTDYLSIEGNGMPSLTVNNYTRQDNRFDVGASLGLGIGKQMAGRFRIEIEVRGNTGITAIIPPTQVFSTGVYNESIGFLLGLRYKL